MSILSGPFCVGLHWINPRTFKAYRFHRTIGTRLMKPEVGSRGCGGPSRAKDATLVDASG
jgi:hypothetical protein